MGERLRWVCLMYHDVAPSVGPSGGGPERFTVPLSSFELMLDTIVDSGYLGCTLAAAVHGESRQRVAITFDDGTDGQFYHAVPALRARNMTATFFVTSDWVGGPGFMTWDQLRQLTTWGMSVQSHTRSHPHLSELDHDRLLAELADSKAILDRELGQETNQIALPGGDSPKRAFRHLLSEAGYQLVATSRWGRNPAPASPAPHGAAWVRRCTVPRSLTVDLSRRIVSGDARLGAIRYTREALLNGVRRTLGASRYARWRRRVLDALAGGAPAEHA